MKHVYIDESGQPGEGYFALAAVAVEDAQFIRSELESTLSQLAAQPRLPGAERVVTRGYFHCANDTDAVRQFFFRRLSRLSLHCKVAIYHYSVPAAATDYDALIAQLAFEMLLPGRPTETADVLVALRGSQPVESGKADDYKLVFEESRERLESHFPAIARSVPKTVAVRHAHVRDEPGFVLPDYCGWAVRRRLLSGQEKWLTLLLRRDLVRQEVYWVAGEAVGADFYSGGQG